MLTGVVQDLLDLRAKLTDSFREFRAIRTTLGASEKLISNVREKTKGLVDASVADAAAPEPGTA